MKTELLKILQMKHYFKIVNYTENSISYSYKKPSTILIKNFYVNWLRFLLSKTQNKVIPIFLSESLEEFVNRKSNFGFIKGKLPTYDEKSIHTLDLLNFGPEYQLVLKFNLILPNEDIIQSFIQWQRYRKYWWSSVSTKVRYYNI